MDVVIGFLCGGIEIELLLGNFDVRMGFGEMKYQRMKKSFPRVRRM